MDRTQAEKLAARINGGQHDKYIKPATVIDRANHPGECWVTTWTRPAPVRDVWGRVTGHSASREATLTSEED